MTRPRGFAVFAYAWAILLAHLIGMSLPGVEAAPKHKKPPCWVERNYNTISRIYNMTVYPNQLPILVGGAAAVPKELFNKNVVGRVNPVGKFTDFETSIEYFFVLAPVPQANPLKGAITSYKITSFSSQCRNVAASMVNLYLAVYDPGSPDHGKPLAPIRQLAFWRFDDKGAVIKYDAYISNLNDWYESTVGTSINDPQLQAATIQELCQVTQSRCTGANAQWSSFDECVSALSAKPYGSYNGVWGDHVVCRTIHLILAQLRPDVSGLLHPGFACLLGT
jgi:hypothetical protein